jgi:cation:H+ antiporter
VAVTLPLVVRLVAAAVALAVLVRGAELAVGRLVALARRYAVPDALVASTVVAVGTSLPELGSHLVASVGILSGTLEYGVTSATVLGGNVGSSTVQQTLLVGVFLVANGRTHLTRSFVRTTYLPMVAVFVVVLALSWDGTVSRLDGALLLAGFLAYTALVVAKRSRADPDGEVLAGASTAPLRDAGLAAVGLAGVLGGAYVVLVAVARLVDVLALNGSMVGVVTIGLAAALPELTTVVESVRRRAPDIALGALVGSNVVNLLVGFGGGGLLSTYAVPPSVVRWDLPFKLVVAAGLLAVAHRRGYTLARREGAWLVGLYFVFVGVRYLLYAT